MRELRLFNCYAEMTGKLQGITWDGEPYMGEILHVVAADWDISDEGEEIEIRTRPDFKGKVVSYEFSPSKYYPDHDWTTQDVWIATVHMVVEDPCDNEHLEEIGS